MNLNLMTTNLYRNLNQNSTNPIAFAATDKKKTKDKANQIPVLVPTQNRQPGENTALYTTDVLAARILRLANENNKPVSDVLTRLLAGLCGKVDPEKSVTAQVGKTNVTTLIDGGQIFKKALADVQGAKKSIQVEMFEFQSKEDFDIHPQNGAETVEGSKEQQELCDAIIKKAQEKNPDGTAKIKTQVILDASKWPKEKKADGKEGKNDPFYQNIRMVKRLLDAGVDVAIYPRSAQGGTKIQHVKLLAVDGEKIIIGGENWGNHSPVNHDACVSIETQDKFKGKGSEVDNIIDTVFNKDWKFAWRMMGIYGSMTEEERHSNLKIIKGILPEAKEYMQIIGNIYDDPKYKERFTKGEFYLPEVKPVKDSAIKVLVNSPIEYKMYGIYDKDMNNESIRTHIMEKLNDPKTNYLRAELFVLTHKEVVEKIIERHKNGTLDAKILVSPDLLKKFTYLGLPYRRLVAEGVPIEPFKVNEDLNQRLHCKWAVWGHKEGDKVENTELLIGSANWSAMGLENNIGKGKRPDSDYELHNRSILREIDGKFKDPVLVLEKMIKADKNINLEFESVFGNNALNLIDSDYFNQIRRLNLSTRDVVSILESTPKTKLEKTKKESVEKLSENQKEMAKELNKQNFDYKKLLENRKKLNKREKELFEEQVGLNSNCNEESMAKIRTIMCVYDQIQSQISKKANYKRGNHECAVVIPNDDIAKTFIRQFEKDDEYTRNKKQDLTFTANNRKPNLPTQPQPQFGSQTRVYSFNRIA